MVSVRRFDVEKIINALVVLGMGLAFAVTSVLVLALYFALPVGLVIIAVHFLLKFW